MSITDKKFVCTYVKLDHELNTQHAIPSKKSYEAKR